MSFLLDTNILSVHLRRPGGLAHRFFQYSGTLYTPSIALAELYVWVYKRPDPTETLTAIENLLFYEVNVVDFDRGTSQGIREGPCRSETKRNRDQCD